MAIEDHLLDINKLLNKYNLKKPKKHCHFVLNSKHKNDNRSEKTNKIFPDRDHSFLYMLAQGVLDPSKILSLTSVVVVLIIYFINKEERKQVILFIFTLLIIILGTAIEIYGEIKINRFYKRKELNYNSRVIVDDHIFEVQTEYIRKSDIVVLKRGDIVPADAVLISSNNLSIQRNATSNNRDILLKSHTKRSVIFEESQNVVLAGDKIMSGRGRAVVVRVGKETRIDEIYERTIRAKDLESLLYAEIRLFFLFSFIIAVFIGVILVIFSITLTGGSGVNALDVVFSVCLALIPECIPSTIKFMLFSAVSKLEKRGIIVRDVGAVEKMGLITVVCADKNAFIPPENVYVSKIFNGHKIFDIDLAFGDEEEEALKFFRDISSIVGLISIDKFKNQRQKYHKSLEILHKIFSRYFITENRISTKIKDAKIHGFDGTIVDEIDFMTAYIAGPVESLLKTCSKIKINGVIQKLTKEKRDQIIRLKNETERNFSSLVALACKSYGKREKKLKIQGSTFLCIFFLEDLMNVDTPLITNILKTAQIGFSLVSDSITESETKPIRRIAGIKTSTVYDDVNHKKVLSSFEFFSSNLAFRIDLLNSDSFVIYQTNSEERRAIIQELRDLNHIVCYIGTDLIDCLALNDSDIGICFENSGVICKEASSILMRTDKVDDLLYCIEEGRLFFVNLQKAIKHISGHILPQVMPFVFYTCLGTPISIPPILLILLNYLIEMIPAINFLYEKPEYNLLIQRPTIKDYVCTIAEENHEEEANWVIRKYKEIATDIKNIISKGLIYKMKILSWNIVVIGTLSTIGCFLGFLAALYDNDVPISKMFFSSDTYFNYESEPLELRNGEVIDFEEQLEILFIGESTYFFGLVMCQFTGMLICRREYHYFFHNFFDNIRILLFSLAGIAACVIILFISFFQSFLLVRSPSFRGLLFPLAAAILILVFDTAKKFIIKRYWGSNYRLWP